MAVRVAGKIEGYNDDYNLVDAKKVEYVKSDKSTTNLQELLADYSSFTNKETLNKFTTNEDGTLLFDGKMIRGKSGALASLPDASEEELDAIYQYAGESTDELIQGYFYKCIIENEEYKWVNVKVQDGDKLVPATDEVLGGIKVGANLSIDEDGVLSADAQSPDNKETLDKFSMTEDGDLLFDGNAIKGSGNVIEELPEASESELNNVYQYIGETDSDLIKGYFYQCQLINSNYKWVNIKVQDADKLVPATNEILGGIKVGDGLTVDETGILSAETEVYVGSNPSGDFKIWLDPDDGNVEGSELATVEYKKYSFDEIVIGEWVDGRPIYRIVGEIPEDYDVKIGEMIIGGYTVYEYTKSSDEENSFNPSELASHQISDDPTSDELDFILNGGV